MPPAEAVNKRIAQAFFQRLSELAPEIEAGIEVDEYDLYTAPPNFFDYNTYRYLWYPFADEAYQAGPEEERAGRLVADQCRRFNRADILALTAPVWNYYVPAILKSWIDLVVAPNQTYRFGAGGMEPLHRLQRLVLFISSGGTMARDNARESLLQLLTAPFAFIGIKETHVVWADGQDRRLFADAQEREAQAVKEARLLAEELTTLTVE